MSNNNVNSFASDDIKITDIIRSIRSYTLYVLKRFYIVIFGAILVGILGYFYAKTSPTKYQSNASFNVVDARGIGNLSSLLGGFGMASFGGSTSNEVLAGLVKSRHAIKSAFLTEVPYQGDTVKLIDIYFDVYGIREAWDEDPKWKDYEFQANNIYELTRSEDSILNVFWKAFYEDYLTVEFEILEGLIKASVKTKSYEFSRGMMVNILDYSSRYFSDKQIAGKSEAYDVAEQKVDSLTALLEGKRAQLGIEQNKQAFRVDLSESVLATKLSSEVTSLSFRLGAAKETLDATRTSLMQDAPVINIIDQPQFAMDIKRKKWKIWAILGAIAGGALTVLILMLVKAANDGFEEEKLQKGELEIA